MENRNYTNKIDALLNGKLSASDRTAFREEVAKDATLEQEVKEHVLEREAIKLLLKEDYKAQIKAWRAEESAATTQSTAHTAKERTLKPQARSRSLRSILSAAASILLLVVGGFWFANTSYSNSTLIEDIYIAANTPGDKSGETQLEENLQNGLNAFVNEDYDTAIRSFRATGNTIDANYYLGHSHFKLEEYAEAIGYFNKVLTVDALPAYINRNQLEYNRLLAQVGAEDTGSAFQQNLDQLIQNGQPPYNQKAQILKDKMGSFWRNFTF